MIVIKNSNQFNVIDCKIIDSTNSKYMTTYDDRIMEYNRVTIVYDKNEEQYYAIDSITHCIIHKHIQLWRCVEWMYQHGFELLELKRKYDKVRYKEEIETWKELERSELDHGKEKNLN